MLPRRSYWLPDQLSSNFPAVQGEVRADVAVIGGGIAGLTTAWLLKQAGRKVAVIEGRCIGAQVTGHSTAKVTSLHKLVYADLARRFDEETARRYGQANQAALALVADTVGTHGIDCDFARVPAYTLCFDKGNLDAIREEAEMAGRLGLPASFVAEPPFPVPAEGGVCFANQAQFHPYRYLAGLARLIDGDGSRVFEDTRASDVEEGEPNTVQCPQGKVLAGHVVVATNLPFLAKGAFFTKAYPRRHVACAARLSGEPGFEGMMINVEEPTRSVRWHRDDGGYVLIATGNAYRPGEADPAALVAELEAWLKAQFSVERIEAAWTNEDFDSMDGMPFIGNADSNSPHLWVATGFGAWGLTGGTAAAQILCDRIMGRDNPHAAIFDATRKNPTQSALKFVSKNLKVGKEFVRDRLSGGDSRSAEELAPGEGAVVKGKVAAYRDESGRLHTLDATCTHMGCIVSWNPVDRTWDCPCHGSCFEADGTVRFGPAVSPLAARDPA